MKIDKKNIIITGASSGIGKALKEYYTNLGNTVVGISRTDDDYVCDVSDSASLAKVFEDIKQKYPILVKILNERHENIIKGISVDNSTIRL